LRERGRSRSLEVNVALMFEVLLSAISGQTNIVVKRVEKG
jgi:hypothetical protein